MIKHPHVNRCNKYARDIISGKIDACLYVKQACQRHLDNLEQSKKSEYPYKFDKLKGEAICKFAEMMPHVKGKWAGSLIVLEPWQCFGLVNLFGWVRKADNLRRFRELYWEIPRKNTKSTIGSIIGNYMFAPDGEPGAEVYSGATTEKQAHEVFRPAWLMTQKIGGYRKRFDIELGGTEKNPGNIYSMATASRFEAVVGKPGDGASVHCGLVDEYHEHKDDTTYDCFSTGMGARTQPIMAILTTAGTNTGRPCYGKRKQIIDILSGQKQNDEIFGIIYTIDSHSQITEYSTFIKLLKGIDDKCKCECAKTILTEKHLQEIYAKLAITKNGKSLVKHGMMRDFKKILANFVQTILTDQDLQDIMECVTLVMSNQDLISTQMQKSVPLQQEKNGSETIRKNAKHPTNDGKKMVAKRNSSLLDELNNMASQKECTIICSQNKKDVALSAGKRTKSFVSTIAMKPENLEGFCVSNVIAQSVYSEILRRICEKHLDICKIHKLKINIENLSIENPPDDFTDFDIWKKANPNYNISVFEDFLRRQHKTCLQEPRKQNILKCKHLNLWSNAGASWLNMVEWEKAADPSLDINDFWGDSCFLGLDLASKIDIASLMPLFVKDGHYYLFSKHYIPENRTYGEDMSHYAGWVHQEYLTATPGNRIDVEYIKNDIREIAKNHDLSGEENGGGEVCNDPWNAQQLVTELMNENISVVEVSQTVNMLSEPMKEIEAAVKDGKFHHDGNPATTWMFGNTMCRIDKKDNVFPFKEGDENKIDGAVATITAMNRAMNQKDLACNGNDGSLLLI
jgi:phage terminase large subunit-like protein